MIDDRPTPLLVLGLGNVLVGDDGAGVAALALLKERWELPDEVRVLDGGTLGLSLLPWLQEADAAILVDGVALDEPVGTIIRLTGEDVPTAVRRHLSVHQVGVADLLDAQRMITEQGRPLILLGVVVGELTLGVGCSPRVAAMLPRLADRVAEEIAGQGFSVRLRGAPEPGRKGDAEHAHRVLGL